MKPRMSSMERVLKTLSYQEPDQVPLVLPAHLHGAKELGLSLPEYFSKPAYVAEGQLRIQQKYQTDAVFGFFYAAIEIQAFGGEVLFHEDGPPNSGEPLIHKYEDIKKLVPPDIATNSYLRKVLEVLGILKKQVQQQIPVIGIVVSPTSLPIMQLGFEQYLRMVYETPDLLTSLLQINEQFCIAWANAQIQAGASVIVYFDPLSSPTILPKDIYLKLGFPIAKHVLQQVKGTMAIHLASGRTMGILEEIIQTGAIAVGVSCQENMREIKALVQKRLAILGNLNGIEMRTWTPQYAQRMVRDALAAAAPGGGYIMSDNHGEIPFQVSDDVLFAISVAAHTWGQYPLEWVMNGI